MRYLMIPICLMMSVLLTGSAWAEDEAQSNEDRAGRRAEMRQKMLEKFDADGDGELNDEERTAAREEMRSRRGDRANKSRARAGEGRGSKAKGDRGARRDGQGRRGGPGGPPDPGKLFDKFDANDDGQLSRAEFMKLSAEMRSQRRPRVADNRDGPRRGGSRRDGPPPEGRRRFERDQPLQNPDDRPGPPSRAEGRRRLLDEDASATRGRRSRGSQGPGARSDTGGRGRPNPEAIFKRFDENSDDQLSRAEFMKLTDHMREMRERMGRGGERTGMRDGHGRRGGPPGEDGPPRRRRSPRADSDDGAETSATDDNSV